MQVRIFSSNTISPIALFSLSLLLLALPSHLRQAYAQEDDGASTTTKTEKIDLTSAKDVAADNFKDVLSACPIVTARLGQCIDEETDVEQCLLCVTKFISDSGVLGAVTGSFDSVVCENVQTNVCSGIGGCNESCGLVTNEAGGALSSFVQKIGTKCESLFFDLIKCVLESQNVAVKDCSIGTCDVDQTSDSAETTSSASLPSTRSATAAISALASIGVASFL